MSSINHRFALGVLVIGTAACSDAPTLPTHAQRPTAPNAALGPKSPDGKIVYAINAVDGIQVMAHDLVAKSTKQLTEYNSLHPNVSADGKRVVVVGPNLTGLGGENLWTMNIDGTKRDTVSSAALEALSGPTFSPDGKRIVFTAKDAVTSVDHLYTIDLKTRAITPLGDPNASAYHPDFSPDGKQIAFGGWFNGVSQPGVMNTDGTNPHPMPNLCPAGIQCYEPAWSPDGSKIAFWTSDLRVMVYDIAGTMSTTIATNAATPSWSPDGTRLAYARREPLETPYQSSGIFMAGVTVALPETPLVLHTGLVYGLKWTN